VVERKTNVESGVDIECGCDMSGESWSQIKTLKVVVDVDFVKSTSMSIL
jgi:hypothetical protein